MRYLQLITVCFHFAFTWTGQYFLCRKLLRQHHSDFEKNTRADQKRVKKYAQAIPSIAICAYRILADWRLNLQERMLLTQLGAATPLIDDYFDDKSLSPERVGRLIAAPGNAAANSHKEAFLIALLREIHKKTNDFDHFNALAQQVLKAQTASMLQQKKQSEQELLQRLSREKGGLSTLLYHALLQQRPAVAGAEEALFHLGAQMQLLDDIFDVYEDVQAGINTQATAIESIVQLQHRFQKNISHLEILFYALPFPNWRVRRMLDLFSALWALGDVALAQFEHIQNEKNGLFSSKKWSRMELVCDMAKPQNQARWILAWHKRMKANKKTVS
jgi:hypothetical protein